jgi:hypothetical protein
LKISANTQYLAGKIQFEQEARADHFMATRNNTRAYTANLREDLWQIVIPTSTKLSPVAWNANFPSREAAENWLATDEGRVFVTSVQRTGRIPDKHA